MILALAIDLQKLAGISFLAKPALFKQVNGSVEEESRAFSVFAGNAGLAGAIYESFDAKNGWFVLIAMRIWSSNFRDSMMACCRSQFPNDFLTSERSENKWRDF